MKLTLETADVKQAIHEYIETMGIVTSSTPVDMKIIKQRAADELTVEITFPSNGIGLVGPDRDPAAIEGNNTEVDETEPAETEAEPVNDNPFGD